MIRSALLALDATEASAIAQQKAISFCQYVGSQAGSSGCPIHLTGVAVVDRPDIERREPAPIGGGAFKVDRDEALLKDACEKVAAILDDFETKCHEAGVPCSTVRSEGHPYKQIERAACQHDLILIGRDTNFHFETREKTGDTLLKLVRDHPRPIIVTSDQDLGGRSIVVAYDGSLQASRALHVWILLGLLRKETEVHVVSINRDETEARRLCDEATTLLSHHDISAASHPIASKEKVVSVLNSHLPALEPRMIVMGAFGKSGLRARFFGSTTMAMIRDCPYPLFLDQ